MSRSVALNKINPNTDGYPLTTGEGQDQQTGETVIFAGANNMMENLRTLLTQHHENGTGELPILNVVDEFIIEIKEPT